MSPFRVLKLGALALVEACDGSGAHRIETDAGRATTRDAGAQIDADDPTDAPLFDARRESEVASAGLGDSSIDAPPPTDAVVSKETGASSIDAGAEAGSLPVATWSLYTLSPGAHDATLVDASRGAPLAGFAGAFAGRDYQFVFDPSAMYTITAPVQPNDQFDWNKLPGLSDCDQLDLSVEGAMFGWRWRLDTTPNVLEVTAYANDASTHLTPSTPLFTLDADDLASETPIHYRFWMDGASYQFSVDGTVRGRVISATATLPRTCGTTTPSSLTFQWAAGFYFGGTSTAPSTITGRVFEIAFQ